MAYRVLSFGRQFFGLDCPNDLQQCRASGVTILPPIRLARARLFRRFEPGQPFRREVMIHFHIPSSAFLSTIMALMASDNSFSRSPTTPVQTTESDLAATSAP